MSDAEQVAECDRICRSKPGLRDAPFEDPLDPAAACMNVTDQELIKAAFERDENGLVKLDQDGNPIERLACTMANVSDDMRVLTSDPGFVEIELDHTESGISLSAGGYSGHTWLGGVVGLRGGNCPGGTCDVTFEEGFIWAPTFSLKDSWYPIEIKHLTVLFLSKPVGTVQPDGSYFVASDEIQGEIQFRARQKHRFAGNFAYSFRINAQTGGLMDFSNNRFRFVFDLQDGSVSAHLVLAGTWRNLQPLVRVNAPAATVECDTSGGAMVHLRGEASDADGDVRLTQWLVDGVVVSDLLEDTVHVPLGRHIVKLRAMDNDNLWASDGFEIDVVDTTPPVVGPGPGAIYCSWPPNHKYVRLDVENQVLVHDTCDPDPQVLFINASSSEPDDSLGDGATGDDIRIYDDAVCLRSERSGTGEGRIYQVGVMALDRSGNQSSDTFQVDIHHDQRQDRCRDVPHEAFVAPDYEDIECPPTGSVRPATLSLQSQVELDGGCATGRSVSGLAIPLLIMLIWGVRRARRSSLLKGVAFIAIVTALALQGCSGEHGGSLEGTVQFTDGEEYQAVHLERAFVFPDPQPDFPDQTLIVATDLDLTCQDVADGLLEEGHPQINLGLGFSGSAVGAYTLQGGGGDEDREFGGFLLRVRREGDFGDRLPIGAGRAWILSNRQDGWELEVALSFVRGADRAPAGEMSGSVAATLCATAL